MTTRWLYKMYSEKKKVNKKNNENKTMKTWMHRHDMRTLEQKD